MLYATFEGGSNARPEMVRRMMAQTSFAELPQNHSSANPFPALIDAIGAEGFAARMMGSLYRLCGASSFSLITYREDYPFPRYFVSLDGSDLFMRELAKLDPDLWRCDALILQRYSELRRQGRRDVHISRKASHRDRALQGLLGRAKVQERLLLCGGSHADTFNVLHIQRSDSLAPMTRGQYGRLKSASQLLFSALNKHDEISSARSAASTVLTSHDEVLERIAQSGCNLARREIEVGAGILMGVTSLGIALRLGIGEQTVLTYRKRLYQRLGISTQRELMLWFMSLS